MKFNNISNKSSNYSADLSAATIDMSESSLISKQLVRRSLKEIALFTFFKDCTVEVIQDSVEVGLRSMFFNPQEGQVYEGGILNIRQRLSLSYDDIFNNAVIKAKRKINEGNVHLEDGNAFNLLTLPGENPKNAEDRLFKRYYDQIKNFCKKWGKELFSVPGDDTHFPVAFLPWIEKIGFNNNGEIDYVSTYRNILEDDNQGASEDQQGGQPARNRWDNILKLQLELTRPQLSQSEIETSLWELKLSIVCLARESEKINNLWSKAVLQLQRTMLQGNDHKYESFKLAALGGSVEVVDSLWSKASTLPGGKYLQLNMLNNNNYEAFKKAALGGSIEVVNSLWNKAGALQDGQQLQREMLQSNNYGAFKQAALGGSVEVVDSLWSKAEALELQRKMLQSNSYEAFKKAALGGSVKVVDSLWNKAGALQDGQQLQRKMLQGNDYNKYEAFSNAALGGSVEVVNSLWNKAGALELQREMLENNNYKAFKQAALGGSVKVVDSLWSKAEALELQRKMLQSNSYEAFKKAALGGNVEVVNSLWSKAGALELQRKMLENDNYEAFKNAALGGSVEVVNSLWNKAGAFQDGQQLQLAMLQSNHYKAFKCAALGLALGGSAFSKTNREIIVRIASVGHSILDPVPYHNVHNLDNLDGSVEVVDSLWSKAGTLPGGLHLQRKMLNNNNYEAFRQAVQNNRVNIANNLFDKAGSLGLQRKMLNHVKTLGLFVHLFSNKVNNFDFQGTVNILYVLSEHPKQHLDSNVEHFTVSLMKRLTTFSKEDQITVRLLQTAIDRFESFMKNSEQIGQIRSHFKFEPPRSCKRDKRSTGVLCIDSQVSEDSVEEEKKQLSKGLFSDDKILVTTKNIRLYSQLFKVSQQISKGKTLDQNTKEALIAKIKDIDLSSIDPEVKDIVKEIKDKIESKGEVEDIFKRSEIARKIKNTVEGASHALTGFLVGKHLVDRNIEGLGYDALNLVVLPKIGEKISNKMLELGEMHNSKIVKRSAPLVGRAIGNAFAFYGLGESIKERINAKDPVDIKVDNLNIVTNSIFIAADVPATAFEVAAAIGVEVGAWALAAPIGTLAAVVAVVASQLIEAKLEVEKLEEQISLTDQEKHDFYWKFFWGKGIPDYIENDIEAEDVYKQYVSKILDQFKGNYDKIAMSLPSVLMIKREYATNSRMGFRARDAGDSDSDKDCVVRFLKDFFATQDVLISKGYNIDSASKLLLGIFSNLFTRYDNYVNPGVIKDVYINDTNGYLDAIRLTYVINGHLDTIYRTYATQNGYFNTIQDMYVIQDVHLNAIQGIYVIPKGKNTRIGFVQDALVMRNFCVSTGIYDVNQASGFVLNIFSELYTNRSIYTKQGVNNDYVVEILARDVPNAVCAMRSNFVVPDASTARAARSAASSMGDKCSPSSQIGLPIPSLIIPSFGLYAIVKTLWDRCVSKTERENVKTDFESRIDIAYPLDVSDDHYSRIIPGTIESYDLACGPRDNNVLMQVVSKEAVNDLPGVALCGSGSPCDNMTLSKTVEMMSLQDYPTNCRNAVIYNMYNKNNSSESMKMLFYVPSSNASINVPSKYATDVIFNGRNIQLGSDKSENQTFNVENHYYLTNQLDSCKIHKGGMNFFYVKKDNFACNLAGSSTGQTNMVVTQVNLTTDAKNIDSIIGSDKANHINVSHASYVDGKGGNDVITTKNFAVIKGYFGNSIYGNGHILLPMNFSDINKVSYTNNLMNIYSKNGCSISIDKQMSVETAGGLSMTLIGSDAHKVTDVQITKIVKSDITLDDGLADLRKVDNSNFDVTKQLLSTNRHIIIGGNSSHIFYPDKEDHNSYWEAPSNIKHFYLFNKINANITIAKANGILDFSQLNSTLNSTSFIEGNGGEIKVNKNGLNVTLLPDYKDVTVTFNGKEYYKLQGGELERDYCSHSLKVDGRFSVKGTDLFEGVYNCLTFDSDEVLFLKSRNDLLLLSSKGILTISGYYPSIHGKCNLSIELNDEIIEPEDFIERADSPSSVRYYVQSGGQELQIYHNQLDDNDVGFTFLKDKSILDCDIKFTDNKLLISYKGNTVVEVEDWNNQATRKMKFAFYDAVVPNWKCVVSMCDTKDVITEFNAVRNDYANQVKISKDINANHSRKRREVDALNNIQHNSDDVMIKNDIGSTVKQMSYDTVDHMSKEGISSSASSIRSPINTAIDWLSNGIAQLKFLSPVDIVIEQDYPFIEDNKESEVESSSNMLVDNVTTVFINGMNLFKGTISKISKLISSNSSNYPSDELSVNDNTDYIVGNKATNAASSLAIDDGSNNNNIQEVITGFDLHGTLMLGQYIISKKLGRNNSLSSNYITPKQKHTMEVNKLAATILPFLQNDDFSNDTDDFINSYNNQPQWYRDVYKDEFDKIVGKRDYMANQKGIYKNNSSEEILADSISIFGETTVYENNDMN